MRILLDENLSAKLVELLGRDGHGVVNVRDIGLASASDEVVIATASADDRILISADAMDGAGRYVRGGRARSPIRTAVGRSSRHTETHDQAARGVRWLAGVLARLIGRDDLSGAETAAALAALRSLGFEKVTVVFEQPPAT